MQSNMLPPQKPHSGGLGNIDLVDMGDDSEVVLIKAKPDFGHPNAVDHGALHIEFVLHSSTRPSIHFMGSKT